MGRGVTSYTFYIILHRTSVITDRGASRSPCMLCDQESSYPSIKDTAKAVEQEHWQTQSLALCPSICSVPGPGSLSRAAALWEESGVMLCISVWGFSGIVGWVSMARIWSGKASGAASVSSSCPHVGQSPFQTAPKTAPLLPKLCPSALCSWLWGKGPEVDSEALGSWECEPRASLLCTLTRRYRIVWCNFTDILVLCSKLKLSSCFHSSQCPWSLYLWFGKVWIATT